MPFSSFEGFVTDMYQAKIEEDLWTMWLSLLSNPFSEVESTFEDFKNKVFTKKRSKKEIEQEAQEEKANALKMLDALGGAGFGD